MTTELAKGGPELEVYERPLAYEVSVWPGEMRDHPDATTFCLTVMYRGGGRWGMFRGSGSGGHMFSLGVDGEWSAQRSRQDDGYDEWLAAHRFDRETALALAWEWAPKMRVVGITAADAQVQSGATVSFRSRSHSGKDRRRGVGKGATTSRHLRRLPRWMAVSAQVSCGGSVLRGCRLSLSGVGSSRVSRTRPGVYVQYWCGFVG